MESIQFSVNAEARGRNGWFRPHTANVIGLDHHFNGQSEASRALVIEVASRRAGDTAPIQLWLSLEDAEALHELLGKAINAECRNIIHNLGK